MNSKFIIYPVIFALTTLACGFSVDLPSLPTPGPEVTEEILITAPDSDEIHLKISFGAGKLNIAPGEEEGLVGGTATYNVPNFKPMIIENGNNIEIKQDELKTLNVTDFTNIWDLKLSETPMDLIINAGAYQGDYEFGGLALTDLTIKDGASDVSVSFSESNPTEMSVFRYETGASNIDLTGLANANFSTLIFNGGAGDYKLDFSGGLQRDATARIETGIGDLTLVIPEDVDARVTVEGGAMNINHSSGWQQSNTMYTQENSGSTLTIIVKMGAGNVTLTD